MKKQINPSIKAQILRSAFILLALVAVSAIPFALAQSRSRGTTKPSVAASTSQLATISNVAAPEPAPPATPTATPTPFTFDTTGSLATARDNHTATLLSNGKVLVAGGFNGGSLASAELYDPATGTWTATGSLSAARKSHTATLLPNGKVLV